MEIPDELKKIVEITNSQNSWRRQQTINLIPSENVMSPLALSVYNSDFMSRYAEGKPYKRYYQGVKYVDEIEVLSSSIINEISSSKYSDVRPISGTIANAAVFRALASCGDKALVAPVQAGAHVSHTKFGTLGALGIEHVFMPYDDDNINVDIDGAIKMIDEVKPKFVVLGGSLYLFPHPVRELAPHVKAAGSALVYDAAHVYGLITGGVWENPLSEGADVVTASTHKTFPGPQGGLILSSEEEVFKPTSKAVFPWFVSNHHLHRLPALAVTGLEMKYFGHEYATQVVKNAKKLAESLSSSGFKVVGEALGFTKSHQVAVDVSSCGGGAKAAKLLEEANIIVNKNMLPWDSPESVNDPSGLRMGTQEMTRYGMREGDMEDLALFMKRVLLDKEDPALVKKAVTDFRKRFLRVGYAFEYDPSIPYGY
ncbi:MAG: serine hydroxymethyltransferase [Thermoprotei archaeon]